MKKTLLFLFALLAGFGFKAHATHDIGGSLTYACVAPGVYVFTYAHYNWGGIPQGTTGFTIGLTFPGCSNTRSVPLIVQSVRHGGYVPLTNGLPKYKITNMVGVVTFTPAEVACGNAVANVVIGTGQPAANIAQHANVQQFTESTINLASIQNSSAEFDYRNEPVLVAAKYQPITLSVAATDADGDSLVYSLVAPITGHNQPITNYATITAPLINPNPQLPYSNPTYPQVAFLNGTSAYSADFPLLSYYANWAGGQAINTAQKSFILDPHSGSLSFTPMFYGGTNETYLVSFQVDEFRKINGARIKVGSIRRETVIIVGDPGANLNPKLSNILVNNAPAVPNTVYDIPAGSAFTLQASGFDANVADSVYLQSNAGLELPGSTFNVSSGKQPTATFSWTPTAAQIRNQPYYLRIWVKDNASPLAARHVETFALRVTNSGGVMGLKPEVEAVNFYAFPNPFTQEISFNLPAQNKAREIVIYNLLGQKIDHLKIAANAGNKADLRWLNAANYPAGTYLAKLVSEDKKVHTIKFTKAQ